MKVVFDDSIGNDFLICWGVTVRLPKYSLFGETRGERIRKVKEKILAAINEFSLDKFDSIHVKLASAWVRYYVFELSVNGERFALNILSPNSPIKSFQNLEFPFIEEIAKPLAVCDEFMLQEWVEGVPLSELRDGFLLRDEEKAKMCIKLASKLLYKIFKLGYVYTPWEDYEAILKGSKLFLLDVTRFVRKHLNPEEFFRFYYGAPFSSPELLVEDEKNRVFWRGISEKDYFGTSRKEYERIFLEGIAEVCKEFEEFLLLSGMNEEEARKIWGRKRY
ncbi:MAG: hypothetical protein QXN34_04330 [Archaeoglobaceae archaeon]